MHIILSAALRHVDTVFVRDTVFAHAITLRTLGRDPFEWAQMVGGWLVALLAAVIGGVIAFRASDAGQRRAEATARRERLEHAHAAAALFIRRVRAETDRLGSSLGMLKIPLEVAGELEYALAGYDAVRVEIDAVARMTIGEELETAATQIRGIAKVLRETEVQKAAQLAKLDERPPSLDLDERLKARRPIADESMRQRSAIFEALKRVVANLSALEAKVRPTDEPVAP